MSAGSWSVVIVFMNDARLWLVLSASPEHGQDINCRLKYDLGYPCSIQNKPLPVAKT